MSDKQDTFLKEMKAKGFDLRIPDSEVNSIRISTGVTALDYVMDGGLAKGHHLELWGENQGGKSLLTLRIIAEFQKLNKICVLIDSENSFDAGWARANDVDPNKLLISEPETLEEASDMMVEMMQKGADLVVVDSIINLINEAELDRDTNEPTRGGNAKVNALMTKKLSTLAPVYPTVFVFVNQVRINMNKTYGDPADTGGGKALKHFYHTRVKVIPAQVIKKDDDVIGKTIKLDCIKNKKGVPRRVGTFDFYHDGFINNNASMLNMAVKYGVVELAGAWYNYGSIKGQGEAKFGEKITEAKLWKKISKEVWNQVNPRLKFDSEADIDNDSKAEAEAGVGNRNSKKQKTKGRKKKNV